MATHPFVRPDSGASAAYLSGITTSTGSKTPVIHIKTSPHPPLPSMDEFYRDYMSRFADQLSDMFAGQNALALLATRDVLASVDDALIYGMAALNAQVDQVMAGVREALLISDDVQAAWANTAILGIRDLAQTHAAEIPDLVTLPALTERPPDLAAAFRAIIDVVARAAGVEVFLTYLEQMDREHLVQFMWCLFLIALWQLHEQGNNKA